MKHYLVHDNTLGYYSTTMTMLLKYTAMAMAYERYRVRFRRTACTLILVHDVQFECVIIVWYTMHDGMIAIAHSPAIHLQWQ